MDPDVRALPPCSVLFNEKLEFLIAIVLDQMAQGIGSFSFNTPLALHIRLPDHHVDPYRGPLFLLGIGEGGYCSHRNNN